MKALSRFAVVLLVSLAAAATTIVPMSIERLARASTDVVLAESADSWTEWDASHKLIYTVTRFHVQRAIKGAPPTEIFVKQLGGSNGGYQQKVAGVRHWRSGEQRVLFLHPAESHDGRYVVTGLMQGNFAVKTQESDPVVSNGIDGVESFDPQTRAVKAFRGSAMRLSRLAAAVRRAQ